MNPDRLLLEADAHLALAYRRWVLAVLFAEAAGYEVKAADIFLTHDRLRDELRALATGPASREPKRTTT